MDHSARRRSKSTPFLAHYQQRFGKVVSEGWAPELVVYNLQL
jgi:hypothetical protein